MSSGYDAMSAPVTVSCFATCGAHLGGVPCWYRVLCRFPVCMLTPSPACCMATFLGPFFSKKTMYEVRRELYSSALHALAVVIVARAPRWIRHARRSKRFGPKCKKGNDLHSHLSCFLLFYFRTGVAEMRAIENIVVCGQTNHTNDPVVFPLAPVASYSTEVTFEFFPEGGGGCDFLPCGHQ